MQTTCIIIPCYNEAVRLDTTTFLSYAAGHPDVCFYFVDDGSRDDTPRILAALSEACPVQIRFSSRRENEGKAQSVREGVAGALAWKPFDFIGFLDADLATPLTEIRTLLAEFAVLPSLQMVFGSRYKTEENAIRRNPWRHGFGRLYAGFVTSCLRLDVYDTQCGAKIMRAAVAEPLFRRPFIDRWLFDVELFCRLRDIFPRTVVTREVALGEWSEKGDSRIRTIDLLRLPVRTARIFLRYRSGTHN
ncbi:MAG: family 2 glycosyl transferase [Flaviaesturariibacter sp.]|nr:family 2 glycosyl transferase [Flaviaesturariibacter sp.]